MLRCALGVFALTVLAGIPRVARGQEWHGPDPAGHYLKAGINLGVSVHADDNGGTGGIVGGEVGYTYLPGLVWSGATAEVARDFSGDNSTRIAIGPKIGYWLMALDVRYATETHLGERAHGVNVRLRATVAVAAVYLGYTSYGFSDQDDNFAEIGLQLKLGRNVAPLDDE